MMGKIVFMLSLTVFMYNAYGDESSSLSQEAKDACSDKEEGDICSFTNSEDITINGACHLTENKSNITCKAN